MQAFFSGVWGLSSVIGPIVGGFITDQLSWRWVFYINVPVRHRRGRHHRLALKEPKRHERAVDRLRGRGAADGGDHAADAGAGRGRRDAARRSLRRATCAACVGAALLARSSSGSSGARADPIVPFELFRNRVVAVAVAAGFLAGVAMFGAISFVPLFAQGALGSTATEAGSLLTPLMLSWVGLSVIGGRLLLKVGYRPTTSVGSLPADARLRAAVELPAHDAARVALRRSGPDRRGAGPDDADAAHRRAAGGAARAARHRHLAQPVLALHRRRGRRGHHGRGAVGRAGLAPAKRARARGAGR